MFTGIITGIAKVRHVEQLGTPNDTPASHHGARLTLQTPAGFLDDVGLGDSIALNGACMTVTTMDAAAGTFTIDISAESLDKTSNLATPGAVLNMEKAMRANDRLDGHMVSGHVDGVGRVTRFAPVGESFELRVEAPASLMRYLAYKGSITVNGVSLTVNKVEDRADGSGTEFSINLIPHTIEHTTLGTLQAGHEVNLEVDMIARYVARMLGKD